MLKLEVIGHIGYDAQEKEVNGNRYIAFSVAVNERYTKSNGETATRAVWISCSKFLNKESELVKYLTKGTQVYLRGDMRVNVYQTKEGIYAAGVNLNVRELELLSSKKDSEQQPAPAPEAAGQPAPETAGNDGLPF